MITKEIIAGVDEAGRGPWAGPVVAGACILDEARLRNHPLWPYVRDSKVLTEDRRREVAAWLAENTVFGLGVVEAADIDRLGIKMATRLAMQQAIDRLSVRPTKLLVDGNDRFYFEVPHESIVHGDATVPAISAASILAKVARDRMMEAYAVELPEYYFQYHKGYGTALHTKALKKYGPSPIHRLSYAPVRKLDPHYKPSLLLHICCAPDATTPLKRLAKQYEITCYWYNPNIHPRTEYDKRLNEMRKLARRLKIKLVEGRYDVRRWQERIRGHENEPEKGKRCELCYGMRLEEVWRYAKQNGFDWFATSLTTSPHKATAVINEIGQRLVQSSKKLDYLSSDFKKENGFLLSLELCKKYGVWRQNYCGCLHSLRLQDQLQLF